MSCLAEVHDRRGYPAERSAGSRVSEETEVQQPSAVATFRRAYDLIALLSALVSRGTLARGGRVSEGVPVAGGLLAFVIFVTASLSGSARPANASPVWNDGAAIHAAPHLRSPAVHRADDVSRAARRAAPQVDSPLPGDASPTPDSSRAPRAVASGRVERRATASGARGYDATAPPLAR